MSIHAKFNQILTLWRSPRVLLCANAQPITSICQNSFLGYLFGVCVSWELPGQKRVFLAHFSGGSGSSRARCRRSHRAQAAAKVIEVLFARSMCVTKPNRQDSVTECRLAYSVMHFHTWPVRGFCLFLLFFFPHKVVTVQVNFTIEDTR